MTNGGPFALPLGAWTDDTAMALALAAHRLVALVVEFAHAGERNVEPLGEDLAELGLARAGRAVEEDVTPGAPLASVPLISRSM